MNNNKKYKKWSLGLVAPALVLAPIAVVASCSSSGEEKAVYSVSFKEQTLSAEVSNKNIKPSKLSKEGFVQEIINNKANIFNIEDSSGQVTDDFLRTNLVVNGNITADDTKKTASAEVTLNNKNTDGGSENATITLTGFDYQEIDLEKLTYTIEFNDKDNNLQTINLEGKSEVSVTSLDKSSLIRLILEDKIKAQILIITGDNADKITNDVLENQILEIADGQIEAVQANGTIQFTLNVSNPVNGKGDPLTKEITFTGFKQETDSTPPTESDKFKIKFKDEAEPLVGVLEQSVSSFTDEESLKPIIIQNKDKIFVAESGTLPADQDWWTKMLKISNLNSNAAEGSITVKMELDGADTTETANDSATTITKDNVVLKGFREEAKTVAKTEEISTVTLGLNGTFTEVNTSSEINAKWVLDNKRLLFTKGFNLIKEASDIKDVTFTDAGSNKATLTFKVEANKWFSADGQLGTNEGNFTITIKGFSASNTTGKLLQNKLDGTTANPLSIALVDPALGEGTYDEFVNDSAKIFNKEFVFKYRKHLLTGDFSQIDNGTADDFLFKYPADTSTGAQARFVKVIPNPTDKTIEIKFTILKDKLVPTQADNKEYSIVFNGFKGN